MRITLLITVFFLVTNCSGQSSTPNEMIVKGARGGKIRLVQKAIKNGANVNCREKKDIPPLLQDSKYFNDAFTPLFLAVRYNEIEIVKLLLENGANVSDTINDGRIPLHFACQFNSPELVNILLDYKSHIDKRANDLFYYLTPLHFAIENNNVEIVKLLLDRGADTDLRILKDWLITSVTTDPNDRFKNITDTVFYFKAGMKPIEMIELTGNDEMIDCVKSISDE